MSSPRASRASVGERKVVYCSFCYWSRKAGTSCASKGSEQASSGTADLFGSAPTQLGLGDESYMSDLYVVLGHHPPFPLFQSDPKEEARQQVLGAGQSHGVMCDALPRARLADAASQTMTVGGLLCAIPSSFLNPG